MNHDQPDNLDWQAFRYVAGEMEAAEAASFERRLDGDLAACEAVARAVELTHAVALAEEEATAQSAAIGSARPVDRRRRPWARHAALAIATAAACLAVMLLRPRDEFRRSIPSEGGVAAPAAADAGVDPVEQLAVAWSETGEQLAALDVDAWPAEADEPGEVAEVLSDADAAADDESELAPSWMLAAVADLSGAPPSSLPIEPIHEER